CSSAPQRQDTGTFVEREIVLEGRPHRYQVFVPARAATPGKAPVVLFLHGSGERGDDNRSQLEVGLGPRVRAEAARFPAIVVFPQAPEGAEWNQLAEVVTAQLEAATREFGGDPDRTYLTGLSMGGYGAWDLALRQPGRFAALVPVCGGLLPPRRSAAWRARTIHTRRWRSGCAISRCGSSTARATARSRSSIRAGSTPPSAPPARATPVTPSSPTPTTTAGTRPMPPRSCGTGCSRRCDRARPGSADPFPAFAFPAPDRAAGLRRALVQAPACVGADLQAGAFLRAGGDPSHVPGREAQPPRQSGTADRVEALLVLDHHRQRRTRRLALEFAQRGLRPAR